MERYQITIINRDAVFSCKAGQSLLGGVVSQRQKAIDVGCRGGGCGVCKIRIISGNYESKKMSIKHVSADELAEGLALSCRIFPNSDMVIEALD